MIEGIIIGACCAVIVMLIIRMVSWAFKKAHEIDDRGFVLHAVLIYMVMLITMGTIAFKLTIINAKMTSNYKNYTAALYLAEGWASITKSLVDFDDAAQTYTWSDGAGGSGKVDTFSVGADQVSITSTATKHQATATVTIWIEREYPVLTGVLSALTTRGPVETNGTITIDGRDHDLNGSVIANNGTLGVYSESTYTQSATSFVGGTNVVDYPPSVPAAPEVILENGLLARPTPDDVLGLSKGTLKTMAQAGVAGGQYVTDPADLVGPLQGVTYIEIPIDDPWWIVAGNTIFDNGTGVVVVHNEATNAIIKNLNQGTFRGLIIADDIVHIHNRIIGALVSLTPAPSSGNVIGNGGGEILYSSEALLGVTLLESRSEYAWEERL